MRKLRVGIDVGGTFTDVVAIDAATRELVARVKVPTTHHDRNGVATGIVAGIDQLLADSNIESADIAFIAHSTTQATNALLEGDLAKVGVLGLLDGAAWLAKRQIRFKPFATGSGSLFAPSFDFVAAGDDAAVRDGIENLIAAGTEAIAATQSFGVDRPESETRASIMRAIAASMPPAVTTSARFTACALARERPPSMQRSFREWCVRRTGDGRSRRARAIPAPLMMMRSDGGVMDVREVERRPILTMLSGPAAGIAGALLYERLSDGIFVEIGGTSSDCSAIRAGHPQMQPATIGGHRTMLRTLDVRTLGIGGGSMLRIGEREIRDVGPRSAHIAGCAYSAFVTPDLLDHARFELIAPAPRDRPEYAVLVARDGTRIALTATCAANLLGTIPDGAFARGNVESARKAFELIARELGGDAISLARNVLAIGAAKLQHAIDRLIADYALDRDAVIIVGGGGGAGALIPSVAGTMRVALSHRARCRSHRADRRRARARPRRRRAHDFLAVARRDRTRPPRGHRSRRCRRRRARSRGGRVGDRHAAQPSSGNGFRRNRARRIGSRDGMRA